MALNTQKLDYEQVDVTVLNIETKTIKNGKNKQLKTIVTVLYNSKNYELKNVTNASEYRFREAKAYLYNDELYANINGIKTSTPIAIIYFAFLFALFPIIIFFAYCFVDYSKFKKTCQY